MKTLDNESRKLFFKAVAASGIPLRPRKYKKSRAPKFSIKKYSTEVKKRIIKAYGGQCTCCGETGEPFLTIDHIFGDGKQDRKTIGSGLPFYRHLEKNGFPKDKYRLLCMNCNFARRFGKDCPHNSKDLIPCRFHGTFEVDCERIYQNFVNTRPHGVKVANFSLPWPEK